MRIFSVGIVASVLLLAGCQSDLPPTAAQSTPAVSNEFGPRSMEIHPVFTQIKDWTGDGKPDGIEVSLEFDDQFHDPTKAAGRVVFELYSFRQTSPDPRGNRLANPWIGSLMTIADQEAHWSRTSRTYTFELAYPKISIDRTYVLTATFDQEGGGRFFDRIVLKGRKAHLNKARARGNSHL
ncbi:MAG TPA: hypothetical protein VG722_00670 [Tepidisphaeraceae bacterium]|nr:hypothetical protein [Tepidisphaeraceae bacterium]